MAQRLLLRVVITADDIRKITFNERPDSIEELKVELKDRLSLPYDFNIQYEDPDFNKWCNLPDDIAELPDKASLNIIPLVTLDFTILPSPTILPPPTTATPDTSTPNTSTASITSALRSDTECSTDDTEILSNSGRREQWPESFDLHIPKFSVDVNHLLLQANRAYEREGTLLTLTRDMKHDILHRLAETIYSFKAYPNEEEYISVAKALVANHPCLSERHYDVPWQGWVTYLKTKMNNFRSKLRKTGMEDVLVNAGKRSRANPDLPSSSMNIKRPKRGEANYLPNLPDGVDEKSLENSRKILSEEMQKKRPNGTLISKLMDQTFPLRRQEIVKRKPPVVDLVGRWPALFTESQVSCYFTEFLQC